MCCPHSNGAKEPGCPAGCTCHNLRDGSAPPSPAACVSQPGHRQVPRGAQMAFWKASQSPAVFHSGQAASQPDAGSCGCTAQMCGLTVEHGRRGAKAGGGRVTLPGPRWEQEKGRPDTPLLTRTQVIHWGLRLGSPTPTPPHMTRHFLTLSSFPSPCAHWTDADPDPRAAAFLPDFCPPAAPTAEGTYQVSSETTNPSPAGSVRRIESKCLILGSIAAPPHPPPVTTRDTGCPAGGPPTPQELWAQGVQACTGRCAQG